ncbi:preprotein translocase subunit YajC [Glutamicibacter uratoxydans]|uniref:preprotein translocase subunit YajC n=1 Tax=Glutamicibacter uratoxydans TaxID=43667 RepID=UPI003D6DBF50
MYSVTLGQAAAGGFNPSLILMVGLFAVLILMMIRGRKKVSKQQETLKEKTVPGAKVMTNSGIFGSVVRIDEQDRVELEVAPGVVLTVHRQAIAQFIEPEAAAENIVSTTESPEETLRRLDEEDKDGRN